MARAHLMRAIEIFRECGADGWVKKFERELEHYLNRLCCLALTLNFLHPGI
jgi:hypothetical protein